MPFPRCYGRTAGGTSVHRGSGISCFPRSQHLSCGGARIPQLRIRRVIGRYNGAWMSTSAAVPHSAPRAAHGDSSGSGDNGSGNVQAQDDESPSQATAAAGGQQPTLGRTDGNVRLSSSRHFVPGVVDAIIDDFNSAGSSGALAGAAGPEAILEGDVDAEHRWNNNGNASFVNNIFQVRGGNRRASKRQQQRQQEYDELADVTDPISASLQPDAAGALADGPPGDRRWESEWQQWGHSESQQWGLSNQDAWLSSDTSGGSGSGSSSSSSETWAAGAKGWSAGSDRTSGVAPGGDYSLDASGALDAGAGDGDDAFGRRWDPDVWTRSFQEAEVVLAAIDRRSQAAGGTGTGSAAGAIDGAGPGSAVTQGRPDALYGTDAGGWTSTAWTGSSSPRGGAPDGDDLDEYGFPGRFRMSGGRFGRGGGNGSYRGRGARGSGRWDDPRRPARWDDARGRHRDDDASAGGGDGAGGAAGSAARWGEGDEEDGLVGAYVGGRGAGGGAGSAGSGGKAAVLLSENHPRRSMAAASIAIPRMGIAATFPLPPGSSSSDATPAPPASSYLSPPLVPLVVLDGAAGGTSPQTGAEALGPGAAAAATAAAGEAGGRDGREPSSSAGSLLADSSAATGAASAASEPDSPGLASAQGSGTTGPLWATVPLLYNFGPSFKLLEEGALPHEAKLPDELLQLANGGLLPGCTAFAMSGGYQALLVQDARSLAPAIAWLRASQSADHAYGIDTEWPPVFSSGEVEKLAMLQIASPSRVLLLHVAQMDGSATDPGGLLHAFLSAEQLTWVACGWQSGDQRGVAMAFGGTAPLMRVVDVQAAARAAGWPRVGLLGLVTELMGMPEFKKPRSLSMTNWARPDLTNRQIRYAALDAMLPPLLLRQLRLFATMPGLRCCFCKQALHAPPGVQQHRPRLQPAVQARGVALGPREDPPAPAPLITCDHCNRTFWRPVDTDTATAPGTPAAACAASTVTSVQAAAAADAASGGALSFRLSAARGREQAAQRQQRRPLFPSEALREDGAGGRLEGSVKAGGEGSGRRKKARKQAAQPLGSTCSVSSRQRAIWSAFEVGAPSAAAAVAMAMGDGGDGDAGKATGGAVGGEDVS